MDKYVTAASRVEEAFYSRWKHDVHGAKPSHSMPSRAGQAGNASRKEAILRVFQVASSIRFNVFHKLSIAEANHKAGRIYVRK